MINITHKDKSLRKAMVSATLAISKQETIIAMQGRIVPKEDVFELSRAAG